MTAAVRRIKCAPAWFETATSDVYNVAGRYEIDVTVTVNGGSYRLHAVPTDVLRILCDHYTYYTLAVYAGYQGTDQAECANNFYHWYGRTKRNLERILVAYLSDYNPLDNYNGEMTIIDSSDPDNPYGRVKTITGAVQTGADVEQVSASGKPGSDGKTMSAYDTRHYSTTYDDTSSDKLQSRDNTDPAGTYTHSTADSTKNFTTWDDYTETETETGDKTHTEIRHGNLGVTTSQSMVNDELDLRRHDILVEYLRQYVHDCLYMTGGDCDECDIL